MGADDYGSLVRQWLTSSAFLETDGSAHYEVEIGWDVVVTPETTAAVVHVGSVSSLLEPGPDLVLQIAQSSRERSTITFDPNVRLAPMGDPEFARNRVETTVAHSDTVESNDADIGWLYLGTSVDVVGRDRLSRGAALAIITLGADQTFVRAPIDGLVEATLCGASHRTAFRAISADTVRELLRRCAALSAVTVSRAGANPPCQSELTAMVGGEVDHHTAKASGPE